MKKSTQPAPQKVKSAQASNSKIHQRGYRDFHEHLAELDKQGWVLFFMVDSAGLLGAGIFDHDVIKGFGPLGKGVHGDDRIDHFNFHLGIGVGHFGAGRVVMQRSQ